MRDRLYKSADVAAKIVDVVWKGTREERRSPDDPDGSVRIIYKFTSDKPFDVAADLIRVRDDLDSVNLAEGERFTLKWDKPKFMDNNQVLQLSFILTPQSRSQPHLYMWRGLKDTFLMVANHFHPGLTKCTVESSTPFEATLRFSNTATINALVGLFDRLRVQNPTM